MSHQSVHVSDVEFAQEVRTERLSLLWQVTIIALLIVLWGIMLMSTMRHITAMGWLAALIAAIVGCLLTGQFLRHNRYTLAAWSYTGGFVIGAAFMLYSPPGPARDICPFIFPVLIFVVGLLLPPVEMTWLGVMAALIIIGVPSLYDQAVTFGLNQFFGLLLTVIAALLTLQAAGELYAIAEWALSSYRRERERKNELHESQIELKRTLARAQVLAENLEKANTTLASTNAELEKARAAAEEAKNFRGRFLANMSHELRTPLNAVMGFSETMLRFPEMYDGVDLPPEYRRDIEQIYTSGTQLLHVINDILDLSKVDAGKLDVQLSNVDLEPIIRASLSTATGLLGDKPVKLLKKLPKVMPLVYADPNRVRQIMLNLYSNAVKFTDEGTITLGLTYEDSHAVISVKDTGCGIPADEQEVIFEEFRQGKAGVGKQRAGSGLGLTIARHLVTLMKGRVWVESQVGVGSTFYFTLPLVPLEEIAAGTAQVPEAERS